jgi:hypothetical protein
MSYESSFTLRGGGGGGGGGENAYFRDSIYMKIQYVYLIPNLRGNHISLPAQANLVSEKGRAMHFGA